MEDETTPNTQLDFSPNGHSAEYKATIAAARELVVLAKYLRESALPLDQLEGVDRNTAVAEVQEKIRECGKTLLGPNHTKHDDSSGRERSVMVKFIHALSAIAGAALIGVGILDPSVQNNSKELMTAGSALLGLAGTRYLDKALTLVTALSSILPALVAAQKNKDSSTATQPTEKKE